MSGTVALGGVWREAPRPGPAAPIFPPHTLVVLTLSLRRALFPEALAGRGRAKADPAHGAASLAWPPLRNTKYTEHLSSWGAWLSPHLLATLLPIATGLEPGLRVGTGWPQYPKTTLQSLGRPGCPDTRQGGPGRSWGWGRRINSGGAAFCVCECEFTRVHVRVMQVACLHLCANELTCTCGTGWRGAFSGARGPWHPKRHHSYGPPTQERDGGRAAAARWTQWSFPRCVRISSLTDQSSVICVEELVEGSSRLSSRENAGLGRKPRVGLVLPCTRVVSACGRGPCVRPSSRLISPREGAQDGDLL